MPKMLLLKLIDRSVGRCLCSLLPQARLGESGGVTKILVIRPGGIGDAVLLAPAIISLKKLYPGSSISILAEKRNAGVFQLVPGISNIVSYDDLHEFFQVLQSRYDVVIDTEQWHRLSALVARFVRAPVKIGFGTNERRRMFTHSVEYDMAAYEPDNFGSLLKPLGIDCKKDDGAAILHLPLQAVSKADRLLQPLGSETFIVIFPGASIPEKRWGADRFRRVTEILSTFGVKVVVVGGKEDRQQGEMIAGGGLGLNLAGLTSLPETAAVIQKCAMLLSGDSGVLHIAAGLNVPAVSLFGPGNPAKWAPQGDRYVMISKDLPCSPCSMFGTTPPCPIHAQCMRDISVDEVVNAVTMLLTSIGALSSHCCKRDWIEAA